MCGATRLHAGRAPSSPVCSAHHAAQSGVRSGTRHSSIRHLSSAAIQPPTSLWPRTCPALAQVNEGELVCVVGRVGSGKTSLVQALLGEMERESGRIAVGGRLAYAAQQAWIINASGGCPRGPEEGGWGGVCVCGGGGACTSLAHLAELGALCTREPAQLAACATLIPLLVLLPAVRDNVTFGKEFDEARWQQCVEACCLASDLEILPAGGRRGWQDSRGGRSLRLGSIE